MGGATIFPKMKTMNTNSEIQNDANGAPHQASTAEHPVSQDSSISEFQSNNPSVHQSGSASPDPTNPTEHPTLAVRRRNGRVARLPADVRRHVNEMLDDGLTYNAIIEYLGEHGAGLDEDHIRRWKARGYQEYLRQQRFLLQCRARSDRSLTSPRTKNPLNGFQETQQLATAQICETVADLGTDILREALAANPLNYFRMLNSFAR